MIGASSVFAHHANIRKGLNAIVMCPTHIVEKWKREIEENIPNSRAYIIHNIKELLQIKPKLLNKYKTENIFVIVSKESAKFSYDIRPCAIWKTYKISKDCYTDKYQHINKGHFVCPECKQDLFKIEKVDKDKVKKDLTELDFLSQYTYNKICPHCGAKLWTVLNKNEDSNWIKVGKEGWMYKDHLEPIMDKLLEQEKTNKKERNLLLEITKLIEDIGEYGEYKNTYKGVRRYSVAKYIKDKLRNVFEYGLFDEVHALSSKDSIQGQAFHHMVLSCKKNLAMTGTLINGYADSIYYILYRMYPNLMRKKGFLYEDVNIFADMYGTTSYQSQNSESNNRRRQGSRRKKKLPGISPLIFTDYLFNNTVFLSLKDMKNELPNYTEIPVGVEMPQDVANGYTEYETFMRETILEARQSKENKSLKIIAPLIKEMMNYPDAPHCAKTVYDPDTEEPRFSPTVLEKDIKPKELELLSIIEEKIANGEKVLVYYNAVHKTDIGQQLQDLLNEQGYNTFELKASVKSEKRESIIRDLIDNKDLDVLICNPSLVETGLDLIDFTTIVFYQVGYNLYTLRQASRRSWRLSQKNDVSVYYLYYTGTVQEKALSLMATKLHAAKTVEGDFDEEGLKAMSDNTDMLTQIANNIVNGMEYTLDTSLFASTNYIKEASNIVRDHKLNNNDIEVPLDDKGTKIIINEWNKTATNNKLNNDIINNPLRLFI